jgi:hypothetical protein
VKKRPGLGRVSLELAAIPWNSDEQLLTITFTQLQSLYRLSGGTWGRLFRVSVFPHVKTREDELGRCRCYIVDMLNNLQEISYAPFEFEFRSPIEVFRQSRWNLEPAPSVLVFAVLDLNSVSLIRHIGRSLNRSAPLCDFDLQ